MTCVKSAFKKNDLFEWINFNPLAPSDPYLDHEVWPQKIDASCIVEKFKIIDKCKKNIGLANANVDYNRYFGNLKVS